MTIGKTIKQLLEERKRVILPGFGNLEVLDSGSGVPASGKRINPPGLIIKFDTSFNKDDGVLAGAFAEVGGIDKEEAKQQVLELVDAIRFALDKGEPYPLSEAGQFRRDEEGKIHFQPDAAWVLEPGQYGLDSMDLLELDDLPGAETEPVAEPEVKKEGLGIVKAEIKPEERPEEAKKEQRKPETLEPKVDKPDDTVADAPAKEESKPEAPKPESPKPEAPKPEPPKPEPPKPPKARPEAPKPVATRTSQPTPVSHEPWKVDTKRRSGLWRAIWIVTGVLIVVLVVLIAVPSSKSERFGKRDRSKLPDYVEKSMNGTEETTTTEGKATTEGTGQAEVEEPVLSETKPVVSEPEQAEPAQVETPLIPNNFYIVAGSFSKLQNASELQDQLKAKGYPAEVMVTENRMYRVSVDSYATRSEAESSLARMKSEPGMGACWLLSNE